MSNYDDWGSGGASGEAAEGVLHCESCGGTEFYSDDDGYSYCKTCDTQSQNIIHAACDHEDIHGDAGEGALYSLRHKRKSQPDAPIPTIPPTPSPASASPRPGGFDDFAPSEPQDFAAATPSPDPKTLAHGIRQRYVQGLQLMLQRQCETLVERLGASPLICGVAGTLWLRYVAVSRVFDEAWSETAIAESEAARSPHPDEEAAAEKPKRPKRIKAKQRMEPRNRFGQRAIYIWLYSLKKVIPVHSSLAIAFLACHIARETILPTDITEWAREGKLPYLTVFMDMDKYLGKPLPDVCPFKSKFMFRPIRVVGAWELEAAAGSIAQAIGLRIPSVNFYGIAGRYLKELSLPVEKILPHACRVYEWLMPVELWLSTSVFRLPTRVCVMSILIVTMRILYNIQGQGVWENGLSGSNDSSLGKHKEMPSIDPNSEEIDNDDKVDCSTGGSMPINSLSAIQATDFDTAELLRILESAYDKISYTHGYSNDLQSYLNYCKDIVFSGRTASFEEERLMERLWKIYEDQQGDHKKEVGEYSKVKWSKDEFPASKSLNSEKLRGETQDSPRIDEKKRDSEDDFVSKSDDPMGDCCVVNCSTPASKDTAVENMKLNMEENGFQYLPPRYRPRNSGYLHYLRKTADGRLIFVAHCDYYILLRTCARLAQVDTRIMHLSVRKLERRLQWTEQQINSIFS